MDGSAKESGESRDANGSAGSQKIKLSNIICIKITKSYYTIVGKYSHPLSHWPNFQKRVQDAARQKQTQALNANHKDVNISGRKATFSLPSVTKLPLLSLPPRIVVTSCQVYSLPLSVRSLPTHQVQPTHLPLHKGRRYQVTHFRPVTRDILQRYAPLGTVTSPVALLARKPIYHPNFARIIRCKRHTNGRLCAFGCHELVRLTPAG